MLVDAITAFQEAAGRIFVAGHLNYSTGGGNINGGTSVSPGRTFLMDLQNQQARQDCTIKQIRTNFAQAGDANQRIKFKVFRQNGANYDMVDESEQFTIPGTGNRVFDLSSPMDCQPGDLVGCWITGAPVGANRVQVSIDANLGVTTGRWVAGDITTSDPFTTLITNKICLEAKASPPFLIVTGDSIPEGHNNGSNNWHSHYHLCPAGTPAAEPANSLRALISGGTLLQYQNFSNGGQNYSWVAATGMPQLHNALPKAILIHCGVNDVSDGRAWPQVEANINTILAIVHADQKLFIDEILPWTAGSDAQAAEAQSGRANWKMDRSNRAY